MNLIKKLRWKDIGLQRWCNRKNKFSGHILENSQQWSTGLARAILHSRRLFCVSQYRALLGRSAAMPSPEVAYSIALTAESSFLEPAYATCSDFEPLSLSFCCQDDARWIFARREISQFLNVARLSQNWKKKHVFSKPSFKKMPKTKEHQKHSRKKSEKTRF